MFRSTRALLEETASRRLVTAQVAVGFIKKISKETQAALAKAGAVAQESLSNVRVVRSFGAEAFEVGRYPRPSGDGVYWSWLCYVLQEDATSMPTPQKVIEDGLRLVESSVGAGTRGASATRIPRKLRSRRRASRSACANQ